MINICDQVHERLGKLVTVRSRPGAIKLVTPAELSKVQTLINTLAKVTGNICGKTSAGLQLSHQGQTILYIQHFHEDARSRLAGILESEKWRKSVSPTSSLEGLAPPLDVVLRTDQPTEPNCDMNSNGIGRTGEVWISGHLQSFAFAESMVPFLSLLSSYCSLLSDLPPSGVIEVAIKIADLLKFFNSRTCQLVLGAGAVSLAGLKTITIRNLGVTLRSLALVAQIIPPLREHILHLSAEFTEKQVNTIGRNFEQAEKDYNDHLGELVRKISQIVDAALQQQLSTWERRPPVPSNSFKAIGKQLSKLHEAVQDVLPGVQINQIFRGIHNQFLKRVADKLKQARLRPDNSPTHGLVVSELIFYRENLKYMNVLKPEDLADSALQAVWTL